MQNGLDWGQITLWQLSRETSLIAKRSENEGKFEPHFKGQRPAANDPATLARVDARRQLASAGDDLMVRVWRSDDGAPIRALPSKTLVYTVAYSRAGKLLAASSYDGQVALWDVGTGEHLHTLLGHSRRVWSVAFSPDGTLLASAGDDGAVGLWSVGGGEPPRLLLTLLGLPEGWAALASDGRYKQEGEIAGQFWHVVGMCRFSSGELDPYLPTVRRLPLDAEF